VIGIIAAGGVEPATRFSAAFEELLQEPLEPLRLGRAARNALRWRALSQQLHEKDLELLTLDEVGRTIISSLELQTVLNIIMEKTRELVHAESWSLLLGEEGEGGLYLSVAVGEGADRAGAVIKPGEGIAGWVAREAKPVVVTTPPPTRAGAIWSRRTGARARSILCVPSRRGLYAQSHRVVNKRAAARVHPARPEPVTRLAGFAAIAIENARLYQQTKQMSLTDELTASTTRVFRVPRRRGQALPALQEQRLADLPRPGPLQDGQRPPRAPVGASCCARSPMCCVAAYATSTSWRATAATNSS
jgi:hypothetical protein